MRHPKEITTFLLSLRLKWGSKELPTLYQVRRGPR